VSLGVVVRLSGFRVLYDYRFVLLSLTAGGIRDFKSFNSESTVGQYSNPTFLRGVSPYTPSDWSSARSFSKVVDEITVRNHRGTSLSLHLACT